MQYRHSCIFEKSHNVLHVLFLPHCRQAAIANQFFRCNTECVTRDKYAHNAAPIAAITNLIDDSRVQQLFFLENSDALHVAVHANQFRRCKPLQICHALLM